MPAKDEDDDDDSHLLLSRSGSFNIAAQTTFLLYSKCAAAPVANDSHISKYEINANMEHYGQPPAHFAEMSVSIVKWLGFGRRIVDTTTYVAVCREGVVVKSGARKGRGRVRRVGIDFKHLFGYSAKPIKLFMCVLPSTSD